MSVGWAKICGASARAVSERGGRQEGRYLYILLPNEYDATRRFIIIIIAAPHGFAVRIILVVVWLRARYLVLIFRGLVSAITGFSSVLEV